METDKDHIHFLAGYDPTKSLSRKLHIICGRNIIGFFPDSIGRRKSFGLMVTLLAVLEKCHQRLYKNT